jgi:hypothetical protein
MTATNQKDVQDDVTTEGRTWVSESCLALMALLKNFLIGAAAIFIVACIFYGGTLLMQYVIVKQAVGILAMVIGATVLGACISAPLDLEEE